MLLEPGFWVRGGTVGQSAFPGEGCADPPGARLGGAWGAGNLWWCRPMASACRPSAGEGPGDKSLWMRKREPREGERLGPGPVERGA